MREDFGKLGGEDFLADVRLRATAFFLGTAIVGMAFLPLGSYAHTALSATQKTAKGFWVSRVLVRVSASDKDALHFVEKLLVYEWRMFALIHLAAQIGCKLSEVLVSQNERQFVLPALGEYLEKAIGGEVLKLVYVKVERHTFRLERVGTGERGHLNLRQEKRAEQIGVASQMAFIQFYQKDFLAVHDFPQVKSAFGRNKHLAYV